MSVSGKNKFYLIKNYFNEASGEIKNKNIIETQNLIAISKNGYGILMNDKDDKLLHKSINLLLKTEFDLLGQGEQTSVFTGYDSKIKKNIP